MSATAASVIGLTLTAISVAVSTTANVIITKTTIDQQIADGLIRGIYTVYIAYNKE